MIRKYTENFSALSILPLSSQKKIMEALQIKVDEAMRKVLVEIYQKNSLIRTKQNYVPLAEMLGAIRTEYSTSPLSFTTYIDEDAIQWRDYQGREIHGVPWNDEPTPSNFRDFIVTDLEHHWRTPIEGYVEDDFLITKVHREVIKVIKTELPVLIKQLAKRR